MREIDPRSIAGKLPAPDRHAPLVVVGAGAAGVAAAIEAARDGVEVTLVDEHPVDNDMMAMDVPLCFGQRMDGSVRNRALMLERVVETNPDLAAAHEAGVDVQLGTYVWGAFVNGPAVQELPGPMLGLADDRRSWLLGYDRLIVAAGARDVLLGFRAGSARARSAPAGLPRCSRDIARSPPAGSSCSVRASSGCRRRHSHCCTVSTSPVSSKLARRCEATRRRRRRWPAAACRSSCRIPFRRRADGRVRSSPWCSSP